MHERAPADGSLFAHNVLREKAADMRFELMRRSGRSRHKRNSRGASTTQTLVLELRF